MAHRSVDTVVVDKTTCLIDVYRGSLGQIEAYFSEEARLTGFARRHGGVVLKGRME